MFGRVHLVVFVILAFFIHQAHSDGILSISLLNYNNTGNIKFNGQCCDGKAASNGECATDLCDYAIKICVTDKTMRTSCIPSLSNRYVSVGTDLNPVFTFPRETQRNEILFDNWMGQSTIEVSVMDVDGDDKTEKIDTFRLTYNKTSPLHRPLKSDDSDYQEYVISGNRHVRPSELRLAIIVRCQNNYYQNTCSQFCLPSNDCNGHYNCDKDTGNKICNKGWEGSNCSVPKADETRCKDTNYCFNGGTCAQTLFQENGTYCCCREGFTGARCENDINECSNFPCAYGNCTNTIGSYHCKCSPWFGGKNCDKKLSCKDQPCRNGGSCKSKLMMQTYLVLSCDCPSHFTGTFCEQEVTTPVTTSTTTTPIVITTSSTAETTTTERPTMAYTTSQLATTTADGIQVKCSKDNYCRHRGICQNGICICQAGFTGALCHIEILECSSYPCQNGGRCNDKLGSYVCSCPMNYTGTHCEKYVPVTTVIPTSPPDVCSWCIHGACKIINSAGFCECKPGFSGKTCSTQKQCSFYQDAFCLKDNICKINSRNKHECNKDWMGPLCRNSSAYNMYDPECPDIACKNDGHCYNGKCCCREGFSGQHCEYEVLQCLSNPCHNNATCVNEFNGFRCKCNPNFKGKFCEISLISTTLSTEKSTILKTDLTTNSVHSYVPSSPPITPTSEKTTPFPSPFSHCVGIKCYANGTCIDTSYGKTNCTCFLQFISLCDFIEFPPSSTSFQATTDHTSTSDMTSTVTSHVITSTLTHYESMTTPLISTQTRRVTTLSSSTTFIPTTNPTTSTLPSTTARRSTTTTQSSTTLTHTTQPSTNAPSTTQPHTNLPSTTEPSTMQPSTTKPSTTQTQTTNLPTTTTSLITMSTTTEPISKPTQNHTLIFNGKIPVENIGVLQNIINAAIKNITNDRNCSDSHILSSDYVYNITKHPFTKIIYNVSDCWNGTDPKMNTSFHLYLTHALANTQQFSENNLHNGNPENLGISYSLYLIGYVYEHNSDSIKFTITRAWKNKGNRNINVLIIFKHFYIGVYGSLITEIRYLVAQGTQLVTSLQPPHDTDIRILFQNQVPVTNDVYLGTLRLPYANGVHVILDLKKKVSRFSTNTIRSTLLLNWRKYLTDNAYCGSKCNADVVLAPPEKSFQRNGLDSMAIVYFPIENDTLVNTLNQKAINNINKGLKTCNCKAHRRRYIDITGRVKLRTEQPIKESIINVTGAISELLWQKSHLLTTSSQLITRFHYVPLLTKDDRSDQWSNPNMDGLMDKLNKSLYHMDAKTNVYTVRQLYSLALEKSLSETRKKEVMSTVAGAVGTVNPHISNGDIALSVYKWEREFFSEGKGMATRVLYTVGVQGIDSGMVEYTMPSLDQFSDSFKTTNIAVCDSTVRRVRTLYIEDKKGVNSSIIENAITIAWTKVNLGIPVNISSKVRETAVGYEGKDKSAAIKVLYFVSPMQDNSPVDEDDLDQPTNVDIGKELQKFVDGIHIYKTASPKRVVADEPKWWIYLAIGLGVAVLLIIIMIASLIAIRTYRHRHSETLKQDPKSVNGFSREHFSKEPVMEKNSNGFYGYEDDDNQQHVKTYTVNTPW